MNKKPPIKIVPYHKKMKVAGKISLVGKGLSMTGGRHVSVSRIKSCTLSDPEQRKGLVVKIYGKILEDRTQTELRFRMSTEAAMALMALLNDQLSMLPQEELKRAKDEIQPTAHTELMQQPGMLTLQQALEESCAVFALAYMSIGNFKRPADGFCTKCAFGIRPALMPVQPGFKNHGHIIAYVRRAVVKQLKADGCKIAKGFDKSTGREKPPKHTKP